MLKTYIIIITISLVLIGSTFAYASAQGQNMTLQNSYTNQNCVNNTNMTTN